MNPNLRLITDRSTQPAPAADFAHAMSMLASGVVIVTCWVGDRPWGMTVTAFTSVSASPPTVLVSLGTESTGARAITAMRRFGVSILDERQLDAARHGSKAGATKFLEQFTGPGDARSASPVVARALAHLDCELSDALQTADHTVFFGRVHQARASYEGRPLIYFDRDYRALADPAHACTSTGRRSRCQSS
jgi:flavin reductase (DIM6/NTAB) family NADH-FMN oxidoreductase RutF